MTVPIWLKPYQDRILRASKTFAQTVVAVILAVWLAGNSQAISQLWAAVDTHWDTALGTALLAALASLGMNSLPGFKKA